MFSKLKYLPIAPTILNHPQLPSLDACDTHAQFISEALLAKPAANIPNLPACKKSMRLPVRISQKPHEFLSVRSLKSDMPAGIAHESLHLNRMLLTFYFTLNLRHCRPEVTTITYKTSHNRFDQSSYSFGCQSS